MSEERRCVRCGAALAGSSGCTRCLLALGLTEGLGSDPDLEPPDRIGPFRVLDALASTVGASLYLAESQEPGTVPTEVEVLGRGADASEMLSRFEAVRPRLARVSHAGLAKLVDAGLTDDGRAWMAAERTGGVPLTEHCDREGLTVDRRLALFLDVCEALACAHEAGVVHGDISPASVRIVEVQGSPRPRVAALGRAAVAGPRLNRRTFSTALGLVADTPGYLSPEQVQDPPSTGDVRTDVYGLGALLCDLLGGSPPFESRRLHRAGWDRLDRVVGRKPPTTPHARLASLPPDAAADVARRRSAATDSLRRALRGDLEAIVGKALEKEPSRRYQTVRALADDVARHRRGERVSARPPSLAARSLAALARLTRRRSGPRSS